MHHPTRRAFTAGLAALATVPAGLAQAQEAFPSRPIKIVAPATPGGELDLVARLLADALHGQLQVPVTVENRPGAGVVAGTEYVVRSAPDGYTLILNGSSLSVAPAVIKLRFDPLADLTPISEILTMNFYLAVSPRVKARNVAELVQEMKARKDPVNYGSSGNGTIPHMQMELLKSLSGMPAQHIPFQGTAPAVQAMMRGDIDLLFAGSALMPHFRAGSMRPLALAMPKRSPIMPELPTLAETLPEYNASGWVGLFGPANMPAEVVRRLNAAMVAAVSAPAFVDRIRQLGAEAAPSTPQALADHLRGDIQRYVQLGRSIGMQPG